MKQIICGEHLNLRKQSIYEKCMSYIKDGSPHKFIVVLSNKYLIEDIKGKFAGGTGVPGYINDSFVTFDGYYKLLANKMAIHFNLVDRASQEIIIQRALQQLKDGEKLKVFNQISESDGFIEDILELIAAFKRAGISVDKLRDVFEKKGCQEKDWDVLNIFKGYNQILKKSGMMDIQDLALQINKNMIEYGDDIPFDLETIIFDGFFDFTKTERETIQNSTRLSKDTYIFIDCDKDRQELFNPVMTTIESFTNFDIQYVDSSGYSSNKDVPDSLKYLRKKIFDVNFHKEHADESLSILSSPGVDREVREIARIIKNLILKENYELEEIAIVLRTPNAYYYPLKHIFSECGIVYTYPTNRKLSQTAIGHFVIGIFNMVENGWKRVDFCNLIKTKCIELDSDINEDFLIKMVIEAGISNDRSNWKERLNKYLQALKTKHGEFLNDDNCQVEKSRKYIKKSIQAYDTIINILKRLEDFKKIDAPANYIDRLLFIIDEFNVESNIINRHKSYYKEGSDILTDEYSELLLRDYYGLKKLKNLLSQLKVAYASLAMEEITREEFVRTLKGELNNTQLKLEEHDNNGVRIYPASEFRQLEYSVVFIPGLREGIYPESISEDWILTDNERLALKSNGLEMETAWRRRAREKLFFYSNLSCATQKLYLTYPASSTDDSHMPSQYIEEVKELFVQESINYIDIPVSQVLPGHLHTACSTQELFMHIIDSLYNKDWNNDDEIPEALSVYESLADKSKEFLGRIHELANIESIRDGFNFSRWDGLLNTNTIMDMLDSCFTYDRVYSITDVETFARCPFMFFCQKILGLAEIDEEGHELSALDVGELYHRILKDFFEIYSGQPLNINKTDEYHKTLASIVDRIFDDKSLQHGGLHRGLVQIEKEIAITTLRKLIINEARQATETPFYPRYLEMPFGIGSSMDKPYEPLILKDSTGEISIKLRGKIDRIDMTGSGNYIVYDYKLSDKTTMNHIKEGRALQGPLYILAARELFFKDQGECVGGAYYSISSLNKNAGLWRKKHRDITSISTRAKSNLEEDEFENILDQTEQYVIEYLKNIRRGYFIVNPNGQCPGYCPFKHICRYDKKRIDKKATK